jgi:hypothetical protein
MFRWNFPGMPGRWLVLIALFPLFSSILFPVAAFAGGPVHGAKAAGMGTAFIGLADDPSAILFNPAG